MRLQTPYERAASALFERLRLVLSDAGLALYAEPVPVPQLTFGSPANKRPNVVWLDPLPMMASTSGSATSFENQTTFTLTVFCMSRHTDRNVAIANVQRYVNSVYMGVMADATLGRNVDNAIPRVTETGSDATPDKQYIVAASVDVTCKASSMCPREFKELVADASRGD
ncbi:hypothetical protein [Olsenella sp. HMSC062G07]|uniref:hypothetical protein n=1 Tax=Olsenella sp. HMSC062G07 TaxID=1739330 RepID=UPI0008A1A7C0|nr:hypothetical protein [Olsenella sp. HMSC062G07]OFK25014.1 hypothetical protein HMPREF2826_00355 [Olsenella sp. HMSC062G07]